MIVKLLTEHYLEFLSLKGGCRGLSESTFVKMPHCWKSCVTAHLLFSGLVTLQYSLYNGFSTTNFLKWVKSKLVALIHGDSHCSNQKERIKLIILCASYAIGLIFNELEKKTEIEFRGKFANSNCIDFL